MGKSRKFSKGISNGFVPEYGHAVETMAESEGLGSSGRVDTDMTLSRHKYFSLNADGHNQFAVPAQVLSLSKINRSERKDLEFKLRRELDQVKILQKKVASIKFDSVSSSSAFSAGKKRPPIQSIVHPLGKKQALRGGNGSVMKRAIPDHVVATNGVYNMVMKQCDGLLTQLMRHKSGWLFNSPVDVVKLNIPDYFTIIKNPMDFGTVKGKIAARKYASPLEFAADVRLTFANAMTYNPAQNNVHIMAKGLSKYFESKWKTIEKKIPGDLQLLPSEKDASHVRSSVIDQGPPMKKKKLPPGTCTSKPESVNKNMSDEEKNKLNTELGSLAAELPDSIIEFLKDNSSSDGQIVDDEIEIDIFTLNEDTLFKLRKLLDDYLMEKEKGPKAELCEIVLHNEGGLNKLSHYGKGNDAVEEDIDIGGNDSPVLSFPPIEIEKDIAHENIKACSSSTSSSSSGSSSSDSDSDSGSLSGGKCEGTKAPNQLNSLEVTMYADETSNHKWINTEDSDIKRTKTLSAQIEQNAETVPSSVEAGDRSEETLSAQVDQNAETVPSSVEAGGRSEGESAPYERQVSPEKVYRATLLKSRFADTILKAQEKTLDEGVKRDPEKLHIEREKLERMQKEEKARLRAAALAAEEARKKADADAAAEVRRKRELKREAARIALHKMEKTVDINESCELLEDLEILRADPPTEDLLSSAKDAYPENIDVVGNFKLQSSSNPLEQLELYMKQDEDEEEEEDVIGGEAPLGALLILLMMVTSGGRMICRRGA